MTSLTGSSKRSSRRLQRMYNDEEEEELIDPGSWECSVCTYRNTADTFHCEMCDTRKGTSTRKPKLNSTVVELQQTVQKIVQQQAATGTSSVESTAKERPTSRDKGPKAKESRSSPSSVNNGGTWSSADSTGGVSSPAPSSTQASTPPQPTSPSASRTGGSVTSPNVKEPSSSSAAAEAASGRPKQFLVDHKLLQLDANSARTWAVTADQVTLIITDYSLTPVGYSSPRKRKKTKRLKSVPPQVHSDDSDSNLGSTASTMSNV